jgi:hypothetical protein
MLPIAETWFERRSVGDDVTLLIERRRSAAPLQHLACAWA